MDYLNELLGDFNDRMDEISKIDGLNSELIDIFRNNLLTLRKEAEGTGKYRGLINKIDTQLTMLDKVTLLPDFKTKYTALREQSLVLAVSAFEVFIADIFRQIANSNPEFYVWSDPREKISIDTDTFSSGFTLGDAMITHLKIKQYSFQDLQSILKATRNYLGIELEVEEDIREDITKGTSIRRIVVHNRSTIDKQFINQTRHISNYKVIENSRISLEENELAKILQSIKFFADQLTQTISQREELD